MPAHVKLPLASLSGRAEKSLQYSLFLILNLRDPTAHQAKPLLITIASDSETPKRPVDGVQIECLRIKAAADPG